MCERKTVSIDVVLLLVAAGFYTYQVHSDKKVGQHSEIKSESPFEKEYKKYCLNDGKCYYCLTKILWAVTVHGYMEENDVENTCGGLR